MKKLTAAIAALALYFSASAFGPEPTNDVTNLMKPTDAKAVSAAKVGRQITSAFKKNYSQATELSWKEKEGLYFAYFKHQGEDLMVAYTPDAELFAVARQIKLADLPGAVSQKIAEKYSDCVLSSQATEIEMDGYKGIYLTVDNKTSTRVVKFYQDGEDEVIQKTKKKLLVGSVM